LREFVVAVRDAAREAGDTVACAIHDSGAKLADTVLTTAQMLLRELGAQGRTATKYKPTTVDAQYARHSGGTQLRSLSEKTDEERASLERMRARKGDRGTP
jgi:hypothetical protein